MNRYRVPQISIVTIAAMVILALTIVACGRAEPTTMPAPTSAPPTETDVPPAAATTPPTPESAPTVNPDTPTSVEETWDDAWGIARFSNKG